MFDFLKELPDGRRKLFAQIVAACFDARKAEGGSDEILKYVLKRIEDAAKQETIAEGPDHDVD